MIAIIDYGAGNIFSVLNALEYLGVPAELTADGDKIRQADAIILPGVGAFPDAMRMLHATGLTELLKEEAGKKPFLGICLGMQMLFEKSWEFEETEGLGLIPGEIVRIPDTGLKIPHMGWNQLEITQSCPFLEGIKDGDSVYFVHSYIRTMACRYRRWCGAAMYTARSIIPKKAERSACRCFGILQADKKGTDRNEINDTSGD